VFIEKTIQNIVRVSCLLMCLAITFSAKAQYTQPTKMANQSLPVCVYIASYSPSYPWQNGIERGIKRTLDGKCHLKTFFMNTKRSLSDKSLTEIGLQAIDFIATNKPDVVIVSDDNAVKYVLQKHYKNSTIPFVFCGVNNTGKNYGLPYKNTTGMIEKNPIREVLKLLFNINPSKTRVAMLTTLGTSADVNAIDFTRIAKKMGIKSKVYQAKDEQEWRKIYKNLQEGNDFDILYLSNRAAFPVWDHKKNYEWVMKHNIKPSFTAQALMIPYVAIGLTKVPDEQGVWAAKAALDILDGANPDDIAVVPNQNFLFWVNKQVAEPFQKILPENIFSQSLIYNENLHK